MARVRAVAGTATGGSAATSSDSVVRTTEAPSISGAQDAITVQQPCAGRPSPGGVGWDGGPWDRRASVCAMVRIRSQWSEAPPTCLTWWREAHAARLCAMSMCARNTVDRAPTNRRGTIASQSSCQRRSDDGLPASTAISRATVIIVSNVPAPADGRFLAFAHGPPPGGPERIGVLAAPSREWGIESGTPLP